MLLPMNNACVIRKRTCIGVVVTMLACTLLACDGRAKSSSISRIIATGDSSKEGAALVGEWLNVSFIEDLKETRSVNTSVARNLKRGGNIWLRIDSIGGSLSATYSSDLHDSGERRLDSLVRVRTPHGGNTRSWCLPGAEPATFDLDHHLYPNMLRWCYRNDAKRLSLAMIRLDSTLDAMIRRLVFVGSYRTRSGASVTFHEDGSVDWSERQARYNVVWSGEFASPDEVTLTIGPDGSRSVYGYRWAGTTLSLYEVRKLGSNAKLGGLRHILQRVTAGTMRPEGS